MNGDFTINARFYVLPGLNQVHDLDKKIQQRVEPRVMQVLCLLAARPGKLLTREEMSHTIWNDYPGAEDAIHQAISVLRKALNDTEKTLIETIPKKGYVFHGCVRMAEEQVPAVKTATVIPRMKWVSAAIVLVIAGATIAYVLKHDRQAAVSADSIETAFRQLPAADAENALNTVTTTAPDGTRFKLVAIGDMRPKFYVNDSLANDSLRGLYSVLIGQMQKTLWERQGR